MTHQRCHSVGDTMIPRKHESGAVAPYPGIDEVWKSHKVFVKMSIRTNRVARCMKSCCDIRREVEKLHSNTNQMELLRGREALYLNLFICFVQLSFPHLSFPLLRAQDKGLHCPLIAYCTRPQLWQGRGKTGRGHISMTSKS